MVYNLLMKKLILDIDINCLLFKYSNPIWNKFTEYNKPYWGCDDFCGIKPLSKDMSPIDLTDLEHEGNDINIINDSQKINPLLKDGLRILKAWKQTLETEYATTPFDICLSICMGDEDVKPSLNLRFWAVRDGYHFIVPIHSQLEKFELNPILIEPVNYIKYP